MIERSNDRMQPPRYSVIITCFNEERSIDEFAARLFTTVRGVRAAIEVVMVDDGSDDTTFERLKAIQASQPALSVVVRLVANSGQAAAITAGLSFAIGDNVVLMDSDLQLHPEDLPVLLAKFEDGDFDVVSGYREKRRDSMLRLAYSKLANLMMRSASGVRLRDFGCTFKVFNGKVIRAFQLGPQRVFSLVDILASLRRYAEIPVRHSPRPYGRSGWTLARLLDLNTDNLLSMIKRPFQYLALFAALGGLLIVLRVLAAWVYPTQILRVVTTGLLLNAILMTFLISAAILALVGELVVRSFASLRGNPAFIVREVVHRAAPSTSATV